MNIKDKMNINDKLIDCINYYLVLSMNSKTIGTYKYEKSKLLHFYNYVTEEHGITYMHEITSTVIIEYLFNMKKTCISNTINKHLKLLKLFYKVLEIDFDYLQKLKNAPEVKKETPTIDIELLKEICFYVSSLDSTGNNLLYKTMLFLLIDTGARPAEVLAIEKSKIDLRNNEITLTHTKVNGQRKVFITDLSKKYIIQMLHLEQNKTKFLLYNMIENKQATYGQLKYLMKKIKETFGTNIMYAYLYRHTSATYWYEAGGDIHFVQKILGHSNISQTTRYVHASTKRRKEIYSNVAISFDGLTEEGKKSE